jgi:hypothetical protein
MVFALYCVKESLRNRGDWDSGIYWPGMMGGIRGAEFSCAVTSNGGVCCFARREASFIDRADASWRCRQ